MGVKKLRYSQEIKRKWPRIMEKHMEAAVKVSLGPHRQTKDTQHLNCLLTCWCQSRKLAVMPSQGVQTTQRGLNLSAKWEKRNTPWVLLLLLFLFVPLSFQFDQGKPTMNHLVYKTTEDKSVSHMEPRLLFFPAVQVSVWQFHLGEKKPEEQ